MVQHFKKMSNKFLINYVTRYISSNTQNFVKQIFHPIAETGFVYSFLENNIHHPEKIL